MVVILGESASGKSTLQKLLVEHEPKYHRVITYTTRPMREGEVDGVDYHFIPETTFAEFVKRDFFAEYTQYRGWYYGTAKVDCEDKNAVMVLNPSGLRALKRNGIEFTSIYLYVDRRARLIAILERGDDIEEAYRRNLTDVGQFQDIKDEVDYVIDNTEFHMTPAQALKCLLEILKTAEEENE